MFESVATWHHRVMLAIDLLIHGAGPGSTAGARGQRGDVGVIGDRIARIGDLLDRRSQRGRVDDRPDVSVVIHLMTEADIETIMAVPWTAVSPTTRAAGRATYLDPSRYPTGIEQGIVKGRRRFSTAPRPANGRAGC